MIVPETNAPEALFAWNGEGAGGALYHAFGLNIRSELPLPEFNRAANGIPADARVLLDRETWVDAVRERNSLWEVDPAEARFWFQGVGGFRVNRGREIIISPEPGTDEKLLRLYVEGMMMATLLFQRGFFVLHASAVRIGEGCVALLGHFGAGKSSVAAALHARGHAVFADDNVAIEAEAPDPEVTPAFPYLKMFPAVAEALGIARHALTPMHSSQMKEARAVRGAFPEAPAPLRCIYVLSRETPDDVTQLGRAESVIEMVRNSVPTRWKVAGSAAHLKQCAAIAARVPIFRVRTFDRLTELPSLAEKIECHAWRWTQ